MKLIDNAVYATVVDYLEGNFTAGAKLYDLSNNGVGLAPFHEADFDVPQAVRDALATIGYNSQVVTATITPQGGDITSLDGLVEVQFAAGAFANPVGIFLRPQVGQPTGSLLDIDRYFEVGVASRTSSQGGENPAQASIIQVQYRNHEIVGLYEASLGLYWWNGSQWVKEQSSVVNTATNTVSCCADPPGSFCCAGCQGDPCVPTACQDLRLLIAVHYTGRRVAVRATRSCGAYQDVSQLRRQRDVWQMEQCAKGINGGESWPLQLRWLVAAARKKWLQQHPPCRSSWPRACWRRPPVPPLSQPQRPPTCPSQPKRPRMFPCPSRRLGHLYAFSRANCDCYGDADRCRGRGGVVGVQTANLRGGPGTAFSVVGQSRQGTVRIIGKNADGAWWQIEGADGNPAWVLASLVETEGPITAVAVAENIPTPPPQATAGGFGYGVAALSNQPGQIINATRRPRLQLGQDQRFLEPTGAQPRRLRWSSLDPLVDAAPGTGLSVMARLYNAPAWAKGAAQPAPMVRPTIRPPSALSPARWLRATVTALSRG